MKTYARIESDTVVEMFETDGDISKMFHPDMVWEDVTAVVGIAERWKKSGAVFTPPPAVSPADIKAGAWEAIKAKRDALKGGGVKVGTKWFHSYSDSKIQQIGLVMMGAGIPAGLLWKTMDGSFVTMTPALAGQIFTAVAAHEQAVFSAAEVHKAAMEAAADPGAYDFSSGWPATYAEATP